MTVDLATLSSGLTESESEPGLWVGAATDGLHYDSARSLHWREAEDGSGWHQHRARVLADVVARFPPGGTLFDVGGGNGFVSRALSSAGFPAVLVEPVPEAAQTAYERGLRPVVNATLEAAGFAPGSLPAIGMFDVLEHLDDDVSSLQRVQTLLVPGGRLYLTVPKHQWLWSTHDEEAGHQRRYSTSQLLDVVRRAGFQPEYHTSFFSVLVAPMALRRVMPSRARGTTGEVVADPTSGDGVPARVVRGTLHHEQTRLRKRARHVGTSILLVARA